MTEDFYTSIEERNYARDRRVTAKRAQIPPAGRPWHWEVCDLCEGRAKVVNPSIDASGLTAEDFAEDPDFAESYKSGMYDITCPRCGGRSTIPVDDNPGRYVLDEEGQQICCNPDGHEFECTGTAYGGDDERWMGEGRCLCIWCGADGDA